MLLLSLVVALSVVFLLVVLAVRLRPVVAVFALVLFQSLSCCLLLLP